jgi:signal peptide peptidase SppA
MSIAQEAAVTTGVRGPLAELGIRSASGRKRKTLEGPFVPFDEWIEVDSIIEGHFMESFAPGSVDKSIAERRDKIRAILHHGREGLGTMPIGKIVDLHADAKFAYYEVELFDGLPTVFLEGVEAGQYGTSMKFELMRLAPRGQRLLGPELNPQNLAEHRHLEVKVIELGPTPFAAYEGAALVGMRSLTDDVMLERLAEDPERLEALAQRSGISLAGVPAVATLPTVRVVPTAGTSPHAAPVITFAHEQRRPKTTESLRSARRHERACDYVSNTVWAMHPAQLAIVLQIIGERVSGHRPTPEEIRERIGERAEPDAPAESESVAVIPIWGTILPHARMFEDVSGPGGTSVEGLREQFRAAMASEDVQAILFDIDSPGGSAEGVDELATEIRAARGSKPIVAQANGFAASAAYYLASQADVIVVPPTGEVGSIGTYAAHQDLSAQMEQKGIKTTLIYAGDYKVEGNPFEPLSDEARDYRQEQVDAFNQMFVAAVAKGRGVTPKTVEADFGQGRMVMAQKAVERGMADRVATFDQTLARLEKEAAKSAATRAAAPDERAPERARTIEIAIAGDATTLERPRRSTRPSTKDYLEREEPKWKL